MLSKQSHALSGDTMKTLTLISTLASTALLLTACGNDDQDRIEELEAEVQSLEEQLDEAQAEPDLAALFPEEDDFNSRMDGPVEARVGDPVEIDLGPFENANDYAATVTLSDVEFTDTCVHDSRDGSTNVSEVGTFVYLTFDIETAAEAEDTFDFNKNAMRWNDYRYHLMSMEAMTCEEDLGFQDPIEPGETAQMTLVLDVPDTEAEFIWQEPTYDVTWIIDGDESVTQQGTPSDDSDQNQDSNESSASAGINADDIDFYQISDPSELYADISTLSDCETASTIWGSLLNAEIEGFDIDGAYLADLEDWMAANSCW